MAPTGGPDRRLVSGTKPRTARLAPLLPGNSLPSNSLPDDSLPDDSLPGDLPSVHGLHEAPTEPEVDAARTDL